MLPQLPMISSQVSSHSRLAADIPGFSSPGGAEGFCLFGNASRAAGSRAAAAGQAAALNVIAIWSGKEAQRSASHRSVVREFSSSVSTMSTAWRRCRSAAAILSHPGLSALSRRLTTMASSCCKALKSEDRSLVGLPGMIVDNLFEPDSV